MYILFKSNDFVVLKKIVKYLNLLGVWFKEFKSAEYNVEVTAEERSEALKGCGINKTAKLNPPNAWETCASCVQIWDWDSLGRGPWREGNLDNPGEGVDVSNHKAWIDNGKGQKYRVAGECDDPGMLNYISCPLSCTKYQPTNIEAAIYVAEQVIAEHERRIQSLRNQINFLEQTEMLYEDAIKTGSVVEYKNGRFVSVIPDRKIE